MAYEPYRDIDDFDGILINAAKVQICILWHLLAAGAICTLSYIFLLRSSKSRPAGTYLSAWFFALRLNQLGFERGGCGRITRSRSLKVSRESPSQQIQNCQGLSTHVCPYPMIEPTSAIALSFTTGSARFVFESLSAGRVFHEPVSTLRSPVHRDRRWEMSPSPIGRTVPRLPSESFPALSCPHDFLSKVVSRPIQQDNHFHSDASSMHSSSCSRDGRWSVRESGAGVPCLHTLTTRTAESQPSLTDLDQQPSPGCLYSSHYRYRAPHELQQSSIPSTAGSAYSETCIY